LIIRINTILFFALLSTFAAAQKELSEGYYQRADSLIAIGNYQGAVEMYTLFLDAEQNLDEPEREKMSEAYNNIGACYYLTREYDAAIEAFKEALVIDTKYIHSSVASRLSNLGMVYKKKGMYGLAVQYYNGAVELAKQNDDQGGLAVYYNNIGSIYDDWGNYDEAIDYYQKSLRIKETTGNREGIAASLSNIGMVYNGWKKYHQAIENYKEALAIDKELGNKVHQAIRQNNIGLAYFNMQMYDSALFYYQKALNLNIELGIKDQVGTLYNNIGMVYFEKEEFDRAYDYLKLAMKIYEELELVTDIVVVYSNIGITQNRLKNYDEAETYLLESNRRALDYNLRRQRIPILQRLSELYAELEQYDLALAYFTEKVELNDSIYSEDIHKQVADFEVRYESERKEKEIEIFKRNEIINNLEFKRERIVRNSLIAGFLLVLLLAVLIYLGLRQRIRTNTIIEKEKAKLNWSFVSL